MLFNSLVFILLFLPISLALFHLKQPRQGRLTILLCTSLFFYGWWNPVYVPLLLFSILANHWLAGILSARKSRPILAAGITLNLLIIGVFKYAQFVVDSIYYFTSEPPPTLGIILPLAISFYTFQQISFLVDAYYQRTQRGPLMEYATYVTFFPQLIAGPIVRHTELVPQLRNGPRPQARTIAQGLTLFSLGLFKKVVFADSLGAMNRPVFAAADLGIQPTWTDAWWAVSTYALQLYYDFSAYSDMAIGLALLFGFSLPQNFLSPYQATSIIQFWNRWHITLTAFFTQYLYFPLTLRFRVRTLLGHTLVTLFVMAVVGLWHGAEWNFLIWGFIHGAYLVAARAYAKFRPGPSNDPHPLSLRGILGRCKVFLLLAVSYPFFRLLEFDSALLLTKALFSFGKTGAATLVDPAAGEATAITTAQLAFFVVLLLVVWYAPSASRLAGVASNPIKDAGGDPMIRLPRLVTGLIVGALMAFSIIRIFVGYESEFLYFQF